MTLFRQVFGEGQPLIILHGLFGSGDNWLTHARLLSDRYRVFLVDQRNHGRSPHHPDMSYPHMAADVIGLMAEEGLRDVILVGHSMGGKTAMHVAREFPHLLDRLVVVDMGIKAYPPHHDRIFEGLFAAHAETASSRSEVQSRLAPFVDDPATLQFLMKNVYWTEPGKLAWRFNLPVLRNSIQHILAAIPDEPVVHTPTLFMRGALSGYIREEDYRAITAIFPDSVFTVLEGAGHWPHAEVPERFLEELREFID